MPDKLWFLRRLNLFDGMTDAEVEEVSRELHKVPPSGCKSSRGTGPPLPPVPQGQEVTTAVLGPGQLFGLGSLFGKSSEATHAEPIQESYVCDASAPEFLQMLAQHPLLMARVMMAMAKQIVHLQDTLESVVSRPVASGLASFLVSMLDQAERTPDGLLLPAISHEGLGKMIGATRESVSRTLADWPPSRFPGPGVGLSGAIH